MLVLPSEELEWQISTSCDLPSYYISHIYVHVIMKLYLFSLSFRRFYVEPGEFSGLIFFLWLSKHLPDFSETLNRQQENKSDSYLHVKKILIMP